MLRLEDFAFFFSCYGYHRDLHSFPTRRSSDLDEYFAILHHVLLIFMVKRLCAHCSFKMMRDRKSTRLNSSHLGISYAVFCLKKKTTSSSTERTLPTSHVSDAPAT